MPQGHKRLACGSSPQCPRIYNQIKNRVMNQKIFIERGEGAALARIFGVTKGCVSTALSFKKNSDLAKRIRKAAIERGGQLVSFEPVKKQQL